MQRIVTTALTLLVLLLLSVPAQAQFTEVWEKSKADGNAPSYIASGEGYNARGLAYGAVDDGSGTMVERVFVASNASGNYEIYVLDPATGTQLTTLDMTGVSGGFRLIEDIGVSDDGIIFGCNLALGQFAQQEFKCYRWNSLTASPTTVISGVAVDDRVGSHISVTGSASDNSLLIHTAVVATSGPSSNLQNVYQFETSDNGSSFTSTTRTAGPESTPFVEDAHPGGAGFFHTYINDPTDEYDGSDSQVGELPAGVADSLTSLQVAEVGGQSFLIGTKVDYAGSGGGNVQGGDARVRIADVTNGASNATFYGETPDLGNTKNIQANSDVDYRINSDGTITVYFLSTNNGVAAFRTTRAPLPVELSSFDAVRNDGAVDLTWTTASETGNAGFHVERSVNGKAFTDVGFRAGSGTTTESQTYRFRDTGVPFGAETIRYRLRQVDNDGGEYLSSTVTVERGVESVELLGSAPNPVSGQASIRYAVPKRTDVRVAVYDVLGREVSVLADQPQQGRKKVQVDASSWPAGTYFIRLTAGDQTRTRQMTVVQ